MYKYVMILKEGIPDKSDSPFEIRIARLLSDGYRIEFALINSKDELIVCLAKDVS
jgi:hypothetical protein